MLSKQERIDFATSFDYIQNECNNRGYLILNSEAT